MNRERERQGEGNCLIFVNKVDNTKSNITDKGKERAKDR